MIPFSKRKTVKALFSFVPLPHRKACSSCIIASSHEIARYFEELLTLDVGRAVVAKTLVPPTKIVTKDKLELGDSHNTCRTTNVVSVISRFHYLCNI